jgi:hypothetical protein
MVSKGLYGVPREEVVEAFEGVSDKCKIFLFTIISLSISY